MSSTQIEPVTANALDRILPAGFESAGGAAPSADLSPEELRELIRLVGQAKESVNDAHEFESDLGGSPDNAIAARLQAWLEDNAAERAKLERLDGEIKFDERDLRWGLSLLDWLRGLKKHPLQRPSGPPDALPPHARLAILGDWGSGRYAAPTIGKTVAAGDYDMAIHLGDVYYAGTKREVRDNFLRHWPKRSGMLSRALNSNHEMYSGGYGYFELTLPEFGQKGSYFAAKNEHFLLLGLDTGYHDHDIDDTQLEWLKANVTDAGQRKVILMSHHQLYKPGDGPKPQLVAKLGGLLEAGKIFAWYWGHEHVAAIFEPDERFHLHARCIGHGGFPYFRYDGGAPVEMGLQDSRWRKMSGKGSSPVARVLDDPNPFVAPDAKPERYGAQGFASLELDGPALIERLHRPDGAVIYEARL